MKLLRQAVAVAGVVTVIMALGLAMKHTPAASLVTDRQQGGADRGRFTPTAQAGSVPPRTFAGHDGRRDQGFDVSRVDDLVQSLVILGMIVAAVVVVDSMRRRRTPVVSVGRSRASTQGHSGRDA